MQKNTLHFSTLKFVDFLTQNHDSEILDELEKIIQVKKEKEKQ